MKKDVYETAFKAVRIAADAYRRGEPGNRQVLGFAARKALDCRIAEAERRDFGAIIELIILSRRTNADLLVGSCPHGPSRKISRRIDR
jgi:hypothetical protein